MVNLDDFKPNLPAREKKLTGVVVGLQTLVWECATFLEYLATKDPKLVLLLLQVYIMVLKWD